MNLKYLLIYIFSSLLFKLSSCLSSVNCKGFVTQHGRLKVLNNQLVDSYNEPIQLRGLSSSGFGASTYRYACVSKESISYAVLNYGITVFRLPILISSSENGYQTNSLFFDSYINDVVTWCEDLGIYVIIDWHVTTPGDPNAWLDSPGASTGLAITFWKKMATKYKTKVHVLYEIANEPSNVTWANVLLYHNSVIQQIRLIDPLNIIIAGTTTWSQEINLPLTEPVNSPTNVLYSFHFYAASHAELYGTASQYLDLVPVFSVWSTSESSGSGKVNYTVSSDFLDLFAGLKEASKITSWTMYAMSDSSQTSSTLIPNSCTKKTWSTITTTGSFINSYLLDSSYFIENDITWCNPAPTGQPTGQPTSQPSISLKPTGQPSGEPTGLPTSEPSNKPSIQPTNNPTGIKNVNSNSNGASSTFSTGAIIGISVGGLIVLTIGLLVVGYAIKSYSNKSKLKSNYTYNNPNDEISMNDYGGTIVGDNNDNNNNNNNNNNTNGNNGNIGNNKSKRGQYQSVDIEQQQQEQQFHQNDDPDFTTATIYRNGDSSISRDITVPASHDTIKNEENKEKRGRQMTKNPSNSQKRPSHSPPPTNPLHNTSKRRQSSRSKSPVPQGSRKKRNSSRSPSPAR